LKETGHNKNTLGSETDKTAHRAGQWSIRIVGRCGSKKLLKEQWRHMRKLSCKESITIPHSTLLGSPSLGTPSPLNLTDTRID